MIKCLQNVLAKARARFSVQVRQPERVLRIASDGCSVITPGKSYSPFFLLRCGWRKLLERFDFDLAINAWKSSHQVLGSILLASFLINLVALAFPLTLLQIYDRIIPNQAITTLVLLILGVGIALILEVILRVCRSYVGAWADAKFEHVMGTEAFKKLIACPIDVYEKMGIGIHLKRFNGLSGLRDFYAGQAVISLIDIPFVVILLVLIGYIGGFLVIVPIVMLLIFIISTFFQVKKLQNILKYRQEHDNRRMNFIIETISNIHTVKAITMESQMLRRHERLQKVSALNDHGISLKGSYTASQGMLLSQITIILIASFGSMRVIDGGLTIGALAACTLLSGRCLQPVNMMVGLWNRVQSIKVAREELEHILSLPSETSSRLPLLKNVKGKIEFRNVSFSYDEEGYILRNLNLKINENEIIGLKGGGLSGKSTILWLVMGILKPASGEVLIDGKNIEKFQPESVRQHIGYFPQKGVLFQGTIMENLTMFQEEYFREAELAAARIGLTEIVERLPDGFDTLVGDKAVDTLPRGVKQRIAIARVLVHKPKIILFDEANTAIDMQGDQIVNGLIKELGQHCTVLLVSHRPSILNLAKRQYVLEKGKLRLAL